MSNALKIVVLALVLPLAAVSVFSEEYDDVYSEAVGQFADTVPESVGDDMSFGEDASGLWEQLKSGLSQAFGSYLPEFKRVLTSVLSLCLFAGIICVFGSSETQGLLQRLVAAAGFLTAYSCVRPLIEQSFALLDGIGDFAVAFVPAYAAVAASAGQPLASAAYSAALIFGVNALVLAAEIIMLPLISAGLAFTAAGSLYQSEGFSALTAGLFKAGKVVLIALSTVFGIVTALQSVINGVSDSAAVATGRFFVGAAVPVVGGRITESMTTVLASLKVVRSSVGITGIAGVLLLCAPVLVRYMGYAIVLQLAGILSSLSGSEALARVFSRVKDGIDLCCGTVFSAVSMIVFSSAVLIVAGG